MDATTFLQSFQRLYDSSNLSDVTILVPGLDGLEDRGQKIFAHKTILAAGSRGFRDYFADNPPEENGGTDDTDSEVDMPVYEVEIRDVYGLDSPDYYVPMLRYLYGLPLCTQGGHLGASALRGMCHAASGFGIPNLRQHALHKLEELLSAHLRVQGVKPADGEPLPLDYQDANIGPFLFELDALLTTDEEDSYDDDTYSEAMQVAVKVCCEYFEILRQFSEFHDRCPSKLYRSMLFYHRSHGCKLTVDCAGQP